jgi:iron-sulfur cluster assembly protein
MLALTPEAIEIVNAITTGPLQPAGAGMRIALHEEAEQDEGFDLQLVPHPEEGDEVLVETGVRVYVQHEAALRLADKVLDAEMNEQGEVLFTLAPHSGNGNHSATHP